MISRILFGLAIFASATTCAYADGVPNAVGRVFGSFGAGVGEAAVQSLRDSQPQWVTIEPRSKEDCLRQVEWRDQLHLCSLPALAPRICAV